MIVQGPQVHYITVICRLTVLAQGSAPVNQSINTFIMHHGTEARATGRIMLKQKEMS